MTKIKLLNNGGYGGLDNVNFPAFLTCNVNWEGAFVTGGQLVSIGGDPDCFYLEFDYIFLIRTSFEVIYD